MQLLQILTSFKYCNKKSYTFHHLMEGVGIIKLKFFCTILFFAFDLMYVNSKII
jgi:hypothetical protein